MQTTSHFLMTTLIARNWPRQSLPISTRALLLGSILPDVAFILLTLAGEIYFRWFGTLPTSGSIMEYLHLTLFFTNPIWIIGHNFFHSLIINSVLIGLGYYGWRHAIQSGLLLFWLAVSMQFHTVIDVFTHASDGPLLFFPLNGSYRFASPVSYWESTHWGRVFMPLEYSMDLLIIGYWGWHWWRKNYAHKSAS